MGAALQTGLPAGTRLGPYEVVAPLSAGGMATLYLGRRVSGGVQRLVAIKVVHAHLARDPSFVSMFLDEARLAARIRHPNVVAVEEIGEEKGVHYIAMEYLRGCSLGQLLERLSEKKRGLSPELAAHIAMKVADGLHVAHELTGDDGQPLGVVHRDVSPQNVFLTYDGQVKLIDFGVAKVRGRDRGTLMGSLKGKIRYMSPEQASSQPVDRRTDVYALGIVLWECLTHQRLFSGGDDITALERVKNPYVASPSALAPQIGPGLDECVMTALAREPEKRFQTTLAFRRAIGGGCPKALEVDAETMAGLLVSVMAEDIERQKREVPALESIPVHAPSADRTRLGHSLTRETPAISEAAVRASLAPAVPVARAAPATMAPPGKGLAPAVIAGIAIAATSVGVGLAWIVASELMTPAAPAAAAPAAPPPSVAPVATADPTPMLPTLAPAVPTGAVPTGAVPTGIDPPMLEEPVLDEDEEGSTHTSSHRTSDRRDRPPLPTYRPGDPPPPAWPPPAYPPGPGPGPGPSPGPGPGPGPGVGSIDPGYRDRPPPPDYRRGPVGPGPGPGPAPGPGPGPAYPPGGRGNN